MSDVNPQAEMRWLPIRNDSGFIIPAFGVVEMTGVVAINRRRIQTVVRPIRDGIEDAMINGPTPIQIGGFGRATRDFPAFALHDTGSTPLHGEAMGAAKDSFFMTSGKSGFLAVGEVGNGLVEVIQQIDRLSTQITEADSPYQLTKKEDVYVSGGCSDDESTTPIDCVTVVAPENPVEGDEFFVADNAGNAAVNNILINVPAGSSATFQNGDNFTKINMNNGRMDWIFDALANSWWLRGIGPGVVQTTDTSKQMVLHFKCNNKAANKIVTEDGLTGVDAAISVSDTDVISKFPGVFSNTDRAFALGAGDWIEADAESAIAKLQHAKNGAIALGFRHDAPFTVSSLFSITHGAGTDGLDFRAIGQDLAAALILGGVIQWEVRTNGAILGDAEDSHVVLAHNGVVPRFLKNGVVVPHADTGAQVDQTKWIFDVRNVVDTVRVGSVLTGAVTIENFGGRYDDVRVFRGLIGNGTFAAIYNGGVGTEAARV